MLSLYPIVSLSQASFPKELEYAMEQSQAGNYDSCQALLLKMTERYNSSTEQLELFKLLFENSQKKAQRETNSRLSGDLAKQSLSFSGAEFRELKGLLAQQSYNFYKFAQGYELDNDVYNALYFALKEYGDPASTTFDVYDNPGDIFIVETQKQGEFYTIHQNGSLLKWQYSKDKTEYKKHSSFWNNVTVNTVEGSKDGLSVFMAGRMKSNAIAEVIDTRDTSRKASLSDLGGSIIDVSYRTDEEIYLLDDFGRSISLYKDRINKTVIKPKVKLTRIEIDNAGKYLYGAGNDGILYQYNLDAQLEEKEYFSTSRRIQSISISQDDSVIAVGNAEGTVYLLKGEERQILTGHTGVVEEIIFSHNGQYIATAGADRTIHVWKLDEIGKGALVLHDNKDRITSLSFTRDDTSIITGTYNRTVKIWELDINKLGTKLCEYLSRDLTQSEWRRFISKEIAYQSTCNHINLNETP